MVDLKGAENVLQRPSVFYMLIIIDSILTNNVLLGGL